MLGPAHLHHADVPADGRAHADVDLAKPQMDDRVREEFLDAEVGEGRGVAGHLGDEERRRVQVPQLLEELEDLVPRALERRERIEGVQAVQGDQVAPHFLLVPRELTSQAEQPSRLLADLFDLAPQRADVDDVHALRVAGVHPERGHLRDEGRAALLHGQVQAGRGALLRLVEQDAVHERGLQGAGRPGDEDDLAAADADVVVRFQGGANAGHTVQVGDELYAFHLLPSGVLRKRTMNVIGNGVVIDPEQLLKEIDETRARGHPVKNLRISDRAHVVMPYHKVLDGLEEKLKGGLGAGTTLRGIGPAFEDKVGRFGIRMCDLIDPETLCAKLKTIVPIKQRVVDAFGGSERIDAEALSAEYEAYGKRLAPFVGDTSAWLDDAIKRRKRILFEGAQGTHLCIDHGLYPFGTSSDCVAGAAAVGAGVGPQHLTDILGVAKAFTSRVGAGPFPTELEGPIAEHLRDRGGSDGSTS